MDLAVWQRVMEEREELIEELTALGGDASSPNAIQRCRERYPRDEVSVALELVLARRKAAGKLRRAARLICDVPGVEQASGTLVARYKARRFASAPAVVDLCTGIGGDAMELARACGATTAVDVSPVRAFMARENADIEVLTADVVGLELDPSAWLHVDPARREEATRRRLWRYADARPGAEELEPIVTSAPAAAVKLGPGVEISELPDLEHREIEIIGDRRGLLQAVMWSGELALHPGRRTATRLDDEGEALSFTGIPGLPLGVTDEPGSHLMVPHAALERADLVPARLSQAGIDAAELAPGLGVLTTDAPSSDPWFDTREILAVLPWRPKKIRDWLAAHDAGCVTVRTRDAAVAADRMQRELRGNGGAEFILFGLRLGKRVVCYVTH